MNHYDPVFDRQLIFDTYACRAGKGTHKAVMRAFHFAKSSRYFLKMDVRKYFDSINHKTLKTLLGKIIMNKTALGVFYEFVDSAGSLSSTGIPIGNLTSQYFANYYLSAFDHYFKEHLHTRRYIRYMDDILIFSENKKDIKSMYETATAYVGEKLKLTLKPAVSGAAEDGAPSGSNRVIRGGSWNNSAVNTRSVNRNNNIGFRVVRP